MLESCSELFGVLGCRGVVDDQGQIRPAIDRERRVFEGEGAEDRMVDVLDDVDRRLGDTVLMPHRPEFGTEPAEFRYQGCDLVRCPGACRLDPEGADHEAGHAVPVGLHGAGTRIEEDDPQDVTLGWWQGAVVAQHDGCRVVPGRDIPGRGPDQRRTGVQRVEHALQARRDGAAPAIPRIGRAPEAEQEQMLALDIGQHQGVGDPVQHIGRRCAATPLFQPGVPGRADIGPLRDFLAPQAGRAAAFLRKAEGCRIELRATILQPGAEPFAAVLMLAHPVSLYNTIRSLL